MTRPRFNEVCRWIALALFITPLALAQRGNAGTGGKCAPYVDGQKVVEGRIPKTQPFVFSGDEGADVGEDAETAVSNDYKQGDNKFTGKIVKVTIDTQPSNLSVADKKAVETAEEVAATIED
jgi:hypothetical protein